uniref:C2H2-type domain-containing protein n=1 Tax=Mycena chlorophos TaxID=658473 RepID=A0ABQ0LBX6_MYCCL|nr:predicted protein [Mycena chlorophos]
MTRNAWTRSKLTPGTGYLDLATTAPADMAKSARKPSQRDRPCPFRCGRAFKNTSGLTQHINAHHPVFHQSQDRRPTRSQEADIESDREDPPPPPQFDQQPPPDSPPRAPRGARVEHHPHLTGKPCDRDGNFLAPGTAPLPQEVPAPDDFSPYASLADFRLADFCYRRVQMSADEIDELMQILASRDEANGIPPFRDHRELYGTIDETEKGHIPWEKFEVKYDGPLEEGDGALWQHESFAVYFRDPREVLRMQLANPDFAKDFDVSPKRVYGKNGRRRYRDFMSGRWAWRQADSIAEDPDTHGAVFVPIITGSDKTTTSVGTGQSDFYPVYQSNGLVNNEARCGHRNAVSVVAFLAIPKTDREFEAASFGRFPGMTKWEVMLFPDGHFRRVIFGLGPYIADYPEQVLLACVVQGWCPRCTAKRTDLDGPAGRRSQRHTEALFEALDHKRLWDDYGVIPDVLVYLPAIEGYVPPQMIRAFAAFLDFCYLVRRNDIGEDTIDEIESALARYHKEREIFEKSGVCPDGFCLPRQHSMVHYPFLIREFAAPNGLCSSITESKHIKAVKEPWRRSSRYMALSQMLTINNRLDNLAATRIDFISRGILNPGTLAPIPEDAEPTPRGEDDDHPDVPEDREIDAEVKLARNPTRGVVRDASLLGQFLGVPRLPDLLRRFLDAQDNPDRDPSVEVPLDTCPPVPARVMTYPSAIATFYAPSDQCGKGGLLSERIRSVHRWRGGPARNDCVYVGGDDALPGFRGLLAARVLAFMSVKHQQQTIPCALVTWFSAIGEEPDGDTGMWMVEPDLDHRGRRDT